MCLFLFSQEIDNALIQFSKHPKLDCTDSVFVVIMTHGELGVIYGTDGRTYNIDHLYEHLGTKNCPALLNKPKIIIIQACRGGDSLFTQ